MVHLAMFYDPNDRDGSYIVSLVVVPSRGKNGTEILSRFHMPNDMLAQMLLVILCQYSNEVQRIEQLFHQTHRFLASDRHGYFYMLDQPSNRDFRNNRYLVKNKGDQNKERVLIRLSKHGFDLTEQTLRINQLNKLSGSTTIRVAQYTLHIVIIVFSRSANKSFLLFEKNERIVNDNEQFLLHRLMQSQNLPHSNRPTSRLLLYWCR